METIKIINRNTETASVQLQDVIKRAITNIGGINEVILEEVFESETGDNILPVYFESTDNGDIVEEHLFNVNLSTYHVE